ncbi:GNAT family N-acetyltransferase [Streptomyces sp. NBC_01803]|uniref:GNAT family N-acetyltransferase n=1 Tax=Streptomyces sp. NBC_01803 TaxID=2975946 RepID=UPI002DDA2CF2|nr:GNAT family N-acetyltransferase [Streptomyces sp. NBC_01803]WSA47673.1 GNAT family N-acetyltransferase [Streptomyces sp. NBC_01803]
MEISGSARLSVRITAADVGKRVSVRTLTGTGGQSARFTDTIGVLTSWTGGVVSITRRDGRVVRLAESSLVAGKVVPPTPARRRGMPAAGIAELTAVAARSWAAPESERIGDWLARAGGGWTRRANSALPLDEGAPDLDRLTAWYRERGLPAALQLMTGAELLAAELDGRGWTASGHTVVQVAPLAPLADRLPDQRVTVGRALTPEWLNGWPRAAAAPEMARRILTAGPSVWFATATGPDGRPAAVGRCVVDGRWAGYAALRVDPAHRRTGLATAVMAELARTALADGASAACLQVETDKTAARTLYTHLGFADHHHYHYRTEPRSGPAVTDA